MTFGHFADILPTCRQHVQLSFKEVVLIVLCMVIGTISYPNENVQLIMMAPIEKRKILPIIFIHLSYNWFELKE